MANFVIATAIFFEAIQMMVYLKHDFRHKSKFSPLSRVSANFDPEGVLMCLEMDLELINELIPI